MSADWGKAASFETGLVLAATVAGGREVTRIATIRTEAINLILLSNVIFLLSSNLSE